MFVFMICLALEYLQLINPKIDFLGFPEDQNENYMNKMTLLIIQGVIEPYLLFATEKRAFSGHVKVQLCH